MFSERLKMDNAVTQDDDDGGKIQVTSKHSYVIHYGFAPHELRRPKNVGYP